MAKAEDANVLEQHVEKLVLLLCLVLLGVAAHRWILSSPVSMDGVPIERVDEMLSEKAQRVKRAYDDTDATVKPVPRWAGKTLALRAIAPQAREDVDVAMPRLPMKVELSPAGEEGLVRLAQLIADMPVPPKPLVTAAMELPDKPVLADVAVAHGALVYPFAELTKAWTDRLKKAEIPVKLTAQEVIVEVQEEMGDGQWGPPRQVKVAAKPDAEGNPIVVPRVPDFDGKNVEEVRGARDKLTQQQGHVLRAEYYQISSSGHGWAPWQPRLPKDEAPAEEPPSVPVVPGAAAAPSRARSVWFHDETMELGRRYRYRVKLVFVNPILTYDKAVSDEHLAEARQTYIETDASEWSDPVSVDRTVHFFLTGASETTGQMTVTVFATKWAQTAMRTFQVRPGELIGNLAKVKIRNPKTGDVDPEEVDFSTGAISLRFHFGIKWLRGSFEVATAKILYLDSQGRLRTRIQARDSADPLRRKLVEEAKRALGGG
ncbi:MAG: hypothetical protein WBF17_06710 [Phycisphaerae bacterium]